ncbi:XRE family transcriptional regulator [Salmonella enterica subsp. enterica serovar Muenchen]|uniref:Helix-turn-helix transcriptional regulator n=1 Tax=Salmonella enterica subsp. enterica serovar Ank TaxID=1173578 RepID=A0A5I2WW78_SALET|nr:XRE family transcriptional regulator [Salmonella enterica subsp. enterica serovar Muenchen]EBV7249299.1 XRE family transcriptional regulator [Salmonella enterica subsp. enterica serovar Pomona]ECF3882176.1 XRE family transcriptional regulator [Salmonella enterica subsp. enterica serovar Ank]EJM3641669.1 helix-turn-helix transcriptional regulator [Salmonella enterica]EEJ1799838.1 helix-turn-helix transcriptional regulator [Salmonella enterica subsp. enterica serovar Pomona]
MVNMSRDYAKKLKAIRNAEKLTQAQFSEVTGVSVGTIGNYESGYKPARIEIVERVINVERFEKYTMWLLHDKPLPQSGQIAPTLSPDGSERHTESQDLIETTQKSRRSSRSAG